MKLDSRLRLLISFQMATMSVSVGQILVLQRSPDVGALVAKIMKSCWDDRVGHVGLAGNVSESFIVSMSLASPIGMILLDGASSAMGKGLDSKMLPYKLQLFAIMAPSSMELEGILIHVKNSRWWNHRAQFYVFNSSGTSVACAEASEFLWTAWTMDILGAKFICNHSVEGPLIYTFNPFTQHAPAPWKVERTRRGVNDHPWTLLVRNGDGDGNICETIDFDQTKDPGGYVVRLTASGCLPDSPRTDTFAEFKLLHKIIQTFSHYMNVTLKMVCHPEYESLGFVDNQGNSHGLLKDLFDGQSDLVPYTRPLIARTHLEGAYPIMHARFFAVTQYTSYQTQWRKIIAVIDRPSRIGLCIVILVNVIFLKYALRQSFAIAIINTFRMICNSCLPKLPNNPGPRIYLACLFCFVVTIQALYQGQLSAVLAKHIRYPNVNNANDLILSPHTIYGLREDFAIFDNGVFEGRFVGMDFGSRKCTDYVLGNSSIACVGFRDWLIDDTVQSKLHMSKHSVHQVFVFWPNRKNWPLQEKSARHNFHYVESGLFEYHQDIIFGKSFRILEALENKDSGKKFKILTLEDLDFAFTILGFGLGCATFSFVIELFSLERKRLPRIESRARCPC